MATDKPAVNGYWKNRCLSSSVKNFANLEHPWGRWWHFKRNLVDHGFFTSFIDFWSISQLNVKLHQLHYLWKLL